MNTALLSSIKEILECDNELDPKLKANSCNYSQQLEPSDELILIPEDTAFSDLKILDYDVIIIDIPPYLSNKLPEILKISDFVLVPTKAGIFDIMAIRATIGLIKEAQKVNKNIQAGIVFNMVKSKSSITKEMRQLLLEYDIPVLNSVISDKVSYIRSLITGGILSSKDYNTKGEMTSLVNELKAGWGVFLNGVIYVLILSPFISYCCLSYKKLNTQNPELKSAFANLTGKDNN